MKLGNKNYINGRNKEYRIVKKYKEQGYDIVQRTAGSHSPFDVIAVNIKQERIKLIQAKPSTMSDMAKGKILSDNKDLNGLYIVEFEVE